MSRRRGGLSPATARQTSGLCPTTAPEAGKPFNLYSQSTTGGSNTIIPYLVDNEGNINFPVLGKLHVAGLTKSECQDMIASRLKVYMTETENPVVTVQMSSYHVTVMGEVGSPKVIPVSTEKMNILEAIASAGDLTIFGHRENIMLIREDARGEKTIHRINLNLCFRVANNRRTEVTTEFIFATCKHRSPSKLNICTSCNSFNN